jgi:hypothetical protein
MCLSNLDVSLIHKIIGLTEMYDIIPVKWYMINVYVPSISAAA